MRKKPEQETEQRCLQWHDVWPAGDFVRKLIRYNTGNESKVDNYAGLTFYFEYSNDDDGDVD